MFLLREHERKLVIEKHEFLWRAGKNRLLGPFTDPSIEREADQETKDSWAKSGQNFNPDIHDEAILAEDALDAGIWRYELLGDLRNSVRLTLVASMYFELEKELKSWLGREVNNLIPGLQRLISQPGYNGPPKAPDSSAAERIQSKPIYEIWNLLKCLGLDVPRQPYFKELDKCRLVVNIYKHGAGSSLDDLQKNYPNFHKKTQSYSMSATGNDQILKIDDSDLDGFAEAIKAFWKSIPDNVQLSTVNQFPKWVTDKP